ncbi:TIGR03750 family conjugal transfer protein [Alcaligenes faecalis]|uniref:TIGR03750 family conjugal transfer protein n=1 Tax=Alcaligenes faecalis TaxID=511 RepID=UPI000B4D2A5D|nr:TIGR03750 family conjugal transfer protein [Alcaligenes faecalis]ASC91774.1 TIGR03750 family conjugal transfer protein [Alcaligenes faecalis]
MARKPSAPHLEQLDEQVTQGIATPITDRVNVQPAILNGMTVDEAQIIGLVSVVVCLLVGLVLLAITGFWQTLLAIMLFGPLVILWFASKYLAGLKRNRPDGYYNQAMHHWMASRGWVKAKFIRHNGYWSLGRTLPFSLSTSFNPKPSRQKVVSTGDTAIPSSCAAHGVTPIADKASNNV